MFFTRGVAGFGIRHAVNASAPAVGRRALCASAAPKPKPGPLKKWGRRLMVLGAGVGTYTVVVAAFNDDMDEFTAPFRSKLPESEKPERPHVVILGSGWAALSMLRKLHTDRFQVTVVSPRNYFLFTPLLPSCITGTIETRSIVEPIREFCVRTGIGDVKFIEAECTDIDVKKSVLTCQDKSSKAGKKDTFSLKYDQLVLGVGMQPNTFNIPGIQENACFMKEAADGSKLRNQVMDCFESACIPGQSPTEQERLLHFVVVGGGPTGVECAAELHDFVKNDVPRYFENVKDKVKITLVEALPHVLGQFNKDLVAYTEEKFRREDINLMTRTLVTGVDKTNVSMKSMETGKIDKVPYGLFLWASGVAPRDITKKTMASLGKEVQSDRRGLLVDGNMKVKGTENVYAVGDCAVMGLPPTAQVAFQQGAYLGRFFNSSSEAMHAAQKAPTPNPAYADFKYNHLGAFAYVGGKDAIFDVGEGYTGKVTFILWKSVYFTKLLSFRNKVNVASDWMKTGVFGRDVSRK